MSSSYLKRNANVTSEYVLSGVDFAPTRECSHAVLQQTRLVSRDAVSKYVTVKTSIRLQEDLTTSSKASLFDSETKWLVAECVRH